jgi:hypothetical protein
MVADASGVAVSGLTFGMSGGGHRRQLNPVVFGSAMETVLSPEPGRHLDYAGDGAHLLACHRGLLRRT